MQSTVDGILADAAVVAQNVPRTLGRVTVDVAIGLESDEKLEPAEDVAEEHAGATGIPSRRHPRSY